MNKKTYVDVVRKLDDSKFKPLPIKTRICVRSNDRMFENLWSMFRLRYPFEEMKKFDQKKLYATRGCSVQDYAWTRDVMLEFYNHPYHKRYVATLKKHKAWGWWVLQCEPCDTE